MVYRPFLAATLACCLAAPSAFAQEAPAATGRCTGLFCDLYYANTPAVVVGQSATGQPVVVQPPDPTHLPCRDFICAAFVGRTPDAVPPAAEPVPAPTVAAEPARAAKRKRKAHKTVASASKTPTADATR